MTADREELRHRILGRLDQLDVDVLQQLDTLLRDGGLERPPAESVDHEPRLLSRRQLLASLLTGGVVLGGSNVATAFYAREQGVEAGRRLGAETARAQAIAESAPTLEKMQAEIDTLRGLIAHYEALERVDIDLALVRSIENMELSLNLLPGLTEPIVVGIDDVQVALDRFEEAVPTIRQGIAHVDDTLNLMDERLEALRQVLADIAERTGPVADSLGEVFDALLDRLPFRIGERIELVVQRLRQVVEAVPTTIASVRQRLLSPLRETWFADTDQEGVQASLLEPVRARLLDPAEQLLSGLDDIADSWQRQVEEPARQALAQREAARQALNEYKQRHGLA